MIRSAFRYLQNDSLYRNSVYLMLATAVLAGFGFFFWIITARLYSTHEIGLATTLISVMNLITYLSLLGFNTSFVRFIPNAAQKNDHINTGMILVSLAAGALSGGFILFVRLLSPSLGFIQNNPLMAIVFVFACVMAALNTLTDAVFLAQRQTRFTLIINIIFSVAKLIFPFFFIAYGAFGIFAAAAIAQTIGLGLSVAAMSRWLDYAPRVVIDRTVWNEVRSYSIGNYVSSAFNLLPTTLLPILIVNRLGAEPAAYYYMAMMIANLLYVIPWSITRSFFAEGSADERSVAANIKKSITFISALLIPSMLVIVVGAGEILRVFGEDYAAGGATFLRMTALISIFVSLGSIIGSLFQIHKDIRSAITMNALYALLVIVLGIALVPYGLTGIGIALIVGNTIATCAGLGIYMHRRSQEQAHFMRRVIKYAKDMYIYSLYRLRMVFEADVRFVRAFVSNGFHAPLVLCYPTKPTPMHALYMILSELGCRVTSDPRRHADLVMYFDDVTRGIQNETLERLIASGPVVNGRCMDISKSRVQDEFEKAFGYGMKIDPEKHTGMCLRKSDNNAAHDGRVIQCPTTPEAGYVYQRLINNVEGDRAVDIRFFIQGDTIAYAYRVERSLEDRFDAVVGNPRAEVSEHITADERIALFRFCKAIGLDYGDLDTLRDKDDGRLYIVDANKTPYGPRLGAYVGRSGYNHFYRTVSAVFRGQFIRPTHPDRFSAPQMRDRLA